MLDIEVLKNIKMNYIEKIEKKVNEEIEQLKQIKLPELNKNEKIKLEEIEHLEQIKVSQIEHFKKIKEEENEQFSNIKNIKFNYETYEKFVSKLFNDLEIFGKNEIENLERIEKDEIELDENFLTKKIEEHKTFLTNEIDGLKINLNHESYISRIARLVLEGRFGNGLLSSQKKYVNETKIRVIFEEENSELNDEIRKPIIIECESFKTVKQLIEEYYRKIENDSPKKKFILKNKELIENLTLWESRIYDCCTIKVINA